MSPFCKNLYLFFLLSYISVNGCAQSAISLDSTLAKKDYDEAIKKDYKGEFANSNTLLFKSSKIFKRLNLHDHYINCQYAIVWNFKNLGEFSKSEATALATLAYIEQNHLDAAYVRVFLRLLGENKSHVGDFKAAEKYFLEALHSTSLKNESDSIFLGWLYNDMGNLYYRKHAFKEAVFNYNQAILLKGDKSDQIIARGNVAMAYSAMGNYLRAISVLNEVVDEEIKLYGSNSHRLINHYINLGTCYSDLGDAYTALEYYEKSLILCASNPDGPIVGEILGNIGLMSLHSKDYKKAILYFDSALHELRKLFPENYPELTHEYNNLANAYRGLANYEKALSYHNKSLRNSVINRDTFMIIRAYNQTAEMKLAQKKYVDAMHILENAIRLSSRYSQPSETYITYHNMASIHAHNNDFSRAIKSLNMGIQGLIPTFKPTNEYSLPKSSDVPVSDILIELLTRKASYLKQLGYIKNDMRVQATALATFEL